MLLTRVKSSSFWYQTLLMWFLWIKALCVLKVFGVPGSVADAASQITLVHTTYEQAWPGLKTGGERSQPFTLTLSF